MGAYLGDVASGSTINFKFTTVGTTGAPTTFIGSTAISCFKDVGTTSLLSTTNSAITLSVDFLNVTGMHHVRITTASDLSFFAASSDFQVVVAGGTVGGTSIAGYDLKQFSIENRSPLRPTTANRTLDVSAGGEAGVDWANVGSPTTTLTLSGTTSSGITNQVVVGSYASGQAPLQPTTAGRTLDVTATGTAGVDWANVEGQTTAVVLSATTVSGISNKAQANVATWVDITPADLTGIGYVQADTVTLKTKVLTVAAAVTVPSSIASPTNITAGTITTATNLTTNNDKTGYTMAVGGIVSGANAAAELNAVADAVLDRNMATGTDSGTDSTAVRTPRQAFRILRNKTTLSTIPDTVTVRKEDDVTTSWTGTFTSAVSNALTQVDPT